MKKTTVCRQINSDLFRSFFVIVLLSSVSQIAGGIAPTITHAASEDSRYGISGKPAPELDLTDWIDGEGQNIDPIRLSGLRGKVVYLYFFQDW